MDNVTFFLETSADNFATWLLTTWRAPHAGSHYGGYQLQALGDGWSRGRTPVRTLTAAAIYVSRVENERGNLTAYKFEDVLSFQLIPIANERVEVQAKIDLPVLLSYLADLIEDMAHPARWPQLRDTLSWRLDWFPETESQLAALEAFEARMRRLKDTPGQRAPIDEPPAIPPVLEDPPENEPTKPEVLLDRQSDIAGRRQTVKDRWEARKPGSTTEAFKREAAADLTVSESTIRDDLKFLKEAKQIE